MKINRRNFLLLSGLSGLSAFGLEKRSIRTKVLSYLPRHIVIASDAIACPAPLASPASTSGDLMLRFVSIADAGGGANQQPVADAMARYYPQHPYDLVLMAGDNIYRTGDIRKIHEVFERPYKPLIENGVKFRACLGNHDIVTDNGDPQVAYNGFNMGGRYYTFQKQNAQFFALDTNNNADWDIQLAWFEDQLKQSQAQWKIVFGHHPIYSSGAYGSNPEFIQTFVPLFQRYGVQLYINGHEHSYERTMPIDGTTYLVVGNAGAHLRPVGQSEWTGYSASRHGFTVVEIYNNRMEIRGVGTDDQVFDCAALYT